MDIVSSRNFRFRAGQSFTSPAVNLDPQTDTITLDILLPASVNPGVQWPATATLKVDLFVEFNGIQYAAHGECTGGNRQTRFGGEATSYTLSWQLPWGFFTDDPNPDNWPTIKTKRWGETTQNAMRGWLSASVTGSGQINSTVSVTATIAPAPDLAYHHSIVYQSTTRAMENNGDGKTSVLFDPTAVAGTNRVAVVMAAADRDSAPTAVNVTWGGNSPSVGVLWNGVSSTPFNRCEGWLFKDSELGSNTSTSIANTVTGGSGVWYGSCIGVACFSGVDQTTPTGTGVSAGSDSGTTMSATVAGVSSTDVIVDGWQTFTLSASGTIGANQTTIINVSNGNVSGANHIMCMSYQSGADGGVMSWTKNTNYEWAGGAVALKQVNPATPSDARNNRRRVLRNLLVR